MQKQKARHDIKEDVSYVVLGVMVFSIVTRDIPLFGFMAVTYLVNYMLKERDKKR